MSTIVRTQPESRPTSAETAQGQLSAYFLDLEGLLTRIDSATTYYQVLGLEREDGQDKIRSSFEHLLRLLYPPYVIAKTMPADLALKIERAFNKASQAFSTLASYGRRLEYDGALRSVTTKSLASSAPAQPRPVQTKSVAPVKTSARSAQPETSETQELVLDRIPKQAVVYSEYSRAKTSDNRRRCERFKLSIPVRVTGYDRKNGKWNEMSETVEVSRTGIRFRLRRRVKEGTVLFVTLPLPTKLRAHGFADQSYNVYSFVRRVEPSKQGLRAIGVEFLGEHPPAGFLDRPWAVFRPKSWGGPERRRLRRDDRAETVRLDYFDEKGNLLSRENAKTENISRYGLRVSGTQAPPDVDVVMVTIPKLKIEGLAAPRNRYIGKDGFERLCLQLLDKS